MHEPEVADTNDEFEVPDFDCNICLDRVKEPVVTICGHLYCWPCLYKWISQNNQCPVCKAGVTNENVIPVYGRGCASIDPRTQTSLNGGIPRRPRGQRPEAIRRRRQPGDNTEALRDMEYSPMAGYFPSFLGLQFQSFRMDRTNESEEQRMQHIILSRYLLTIGALVLICLILF